MCTAWCLLCVQKRSFEWDLGASLLFQMAHEHENGRKKKKTYRPMLSREEECKCKRKHHLGETDSSEPFLDQESIL